MSHTLSFSSTRLPPSHHHASAFCGGFATNATPPYLHPLSHPSQPQPRRPLLHRPPSAAILRALCLKSDNLRSTPFEGGQGGLYPAGQERVA